MPGNLFTNYFLTEGIKATVEWRASISDSTAFAVFRDGVGQCYDALSDSEGPNEAVTEQELIRPVLELLGWADYLPQQGTTRNEDIPDYLLFTDAVSKERAAGRTNPEERFRDAIVVEESKRFGLSLDAHALVVVCREMDVRFSITIRQHARLRELIEAIPEEDWTPVPYWMDGGADVAETTYTPFQGEPEAAPVRLIVRRVKPTPGSQLALFASYSYHGFITDRDGETLELEADHRRHAEIENAIRDLKHGVGLNHFPSGRFPANGAWLAVQVLAHNLARWTARIGLGGGVVTTRTLRRRFFSLAGRLTRSARRLTLHLPQGWPWETQFTRALARLRALPLPA